MTTRRRTSTRRPSARREATRQRLLDGARRVFAEVGVHGASVEDICEAAGYTRGAFYSNFDTKEDLVVALMAGEEATIVQALGAAIETGRHDDLGMRGVVDLFVAGQPVDREHALMQAELRLHAVRSPAVAARLVTGRDAFLAKLAELADEGLARVGRRFTVPTADAVLTLLAVAETSLRDELSRGVEEWEGLPGVAMLLLTLLEAISEPVG